MSVIRAMIGAQKALGIGTVLLIPASLYMVFVYAPNEATMGVVQRIFYYHVATAWNGYLFIGLVALMSLIYLIRREETWNRAARSAAELGVLFITLTLIAGSLWARPVWNVWWTWDPRLVTTLILWFFYVAYLLIQAGAGESQRQKRFAAAFGIIGVIDIPLVHYSVVLWRSIHPNVVRPGNPGMPPEMLITMIVSVIAFTVLGLYLWSRRLEVESLSQRVEALKAKVLPL
ncbi:MAG TPA: cytochrome c biogenesis protein CcsA [Limnochordia bacterium]|nr:cytochrome c biogenesis protein CcsA [Limnochordia bacterium]